MILNRKVPAAVATTSLLILRNWLGERFWPSPGVNTFPINDRLPLSPDGCECTADLISLRERRPTFRSQEADPNRQHTVARSNVIKSIGVIGDSISDEYRFYAPDRVTARNWVEILAATRGLDFGDPMITRGGATLDRGFAYNWSRSGATTSILMDGEQHTRLAARVRGGAALDLAAITIGSNDFADALITSRTPADLAPTLDRANSNIVAILDSLLGIDPEFKVALFTVVDLRTSPILRGAQEFGLISPTMANAYAATIAEFNDGLRDLIAGHGHRAVIVDINQLLIDVTSAQRFAIGNLEINRKDASNDPRHLFLSDGFHPGTIGQCLIANQFLAAINEGFGSDVELVGNEEMLRIATTVPKPSGLSLLGTGVLAQFGYRRRPHREA